MNQVILIELDKALAIALDARNGKKDIYNKLKALPKTTESKKEIVAYKMAVKSLEAKLNYYRSKHQN